MRAEIETWCNSTPKTFMAPKVTATVMGIAVRDQRHVERQKQHGHENDGGDGNPEFPDKMGDAFLHHARLVGHEIDADVRGKVFYLLQFGAQGVPEFSDIVAFLHFDRQHQRRLSHEARGKFQVLVSAAHVGHIPDVHGLAARGRQVDDHAPDLVLGLERSVGIHLNFRGGGIQAAGILDGVAPLQCGGDFRGIEGVLRKTLQRTGDPNFLRLLADASDLGHGPESP